MILNGKLPESGVTELNKRIQERYGTFWDGKPNFRIIWSEDETEKRRTRYSDKGIELAQWEVRELPKYKQWIHQKYVLERLTVVPEFVETDLVEKFSYEPLWVFEDKNGVALVPTWPACWHILETVLHAMDNTHYVKYKDPESDPKEAKEVYKARIDALVDDLFGNETDVTDALGLKEGIVVPRSYES
jgi:hypothetical protein